MFLGEFEKYTSLYAKGAKKISIRSSYHLITIELLNTIRGAKSKHKVGYKQGTPL